MLGFGLGHGGQKSGQGRWAVLDGLVENLPKLKEKASNGISVELIMPPPQEIPYLAHYVYFKINHRHAKWEDVERCKNILVYCGDKTFPEETTMVLYSVPAIEE